jgi:tetratricopeptide (TPR) repeat protein
MKYLLIISLSLLVLSCGTTKEAGGRNSKPVDAAYVTAFHEAIRLKTVGQINEAIAAFEKCLTMRDDDDAVFYALSELYLIKNDRLTSANHIRKAAELDPGNIWYTQELAYMYFESGNYNESVKNFEKLIKKEPRNIDWLYGYAEALVKAGKTEEAIGAYNKMEDQLGTYPELSIQKFQLYVSLKQDAKGIEEIEKARKKFPQDSQLIATLVDYYFQRGKENEAIQMLEQLSIADPKNGRANLALADICRQKGDQKKSMQYLKKAFDCPDVTLDNKMQILINIHETAFMVDPEVLDLVAMVLRDHPTDAKSYSINGDFLLRQEKDTEALKAYKTALKYDKTQYPIWNQVLIMEYQNSDFTSLFDHANECLEYFPTIPTVYLLSGVAAVQLKQYQKAITTLESGVELIVSDKSMEAEFNGQLGEAYFGIKDFVKGKAFYEKAIKLDPNSSLIKNNYAYRLAINKTDLQRALDVINEVIALNSQSSHFLDTKGLVLFELKLYEEAKLFFDKAFLISPNDKMIVEHVGDVLFKMGKKNEAVEMWVKAKEMGSTNQMIDKKIEKKEYYDPIY